MQEDLRIWVEGQSDRPLVLRAKGEVDMLTIDMFARRLHQVCATACPHSTVVIDLRQLRFFCCAGPRVLIEAHQLCRDNDIALRMKANRAVLRTLELTEMDRLLPITSETPL
jgi:anti-anti-sigma factor